MEVKMEQKIRFKDCPECKGDTEEIVFCPTCFRRGQKETKK